MPSNEGNYTDPTPGNGELPEFHSFAEALIYSRENATDEQLRHIPAFLASLSRNEYPIGHWPRSIHRN